MRLSDFFCFEATVPELQSTDRDGAIAELVAALVKAGRLPAELAEETTKAVIKRENEASTGMGKGVAVPHVKIPEVLDFVLTFGRHASGLDFDSLDDQPVHLVAMIGASDSQAGEFLKMLARLVQTFRAKDVRRSLLQAENEQDFRAILRNQIGR